MLMKAPNALISEISEKADRLRAEILAASHEIPVGKNVYYVSPNGDDAADGRSPETAWKTTDALSAHTFEPGSEILFECGGLWRGSFIAPAGVTISSWGKGEKPRFYGNLWDGAKEGAWDEVKPGVWRYDRKMPEDCGSIVMDGGAYHAVKLVVNYAGETPVDNITKEPFLGLDSLKNDLTFWHDLGGPVASNPEGGYIYLCSKSGNPAERFGEIEFLPRRNVIRVGGDGITFDNICVMYGGAHGIGSGTTKDLTVKNCVFGWIGGGMQFYRDGRPTRFGNGVEIYGGCENYTIDHCYVYQVYDAGVTHQLSSGGANGCIMKHVRYTNNLIEYCTYNIEYFLGKSSDPNAVREMSDIEIRGNILRYAGFGWGDERPDKSAASHIKGWDAENKLADGHYVVEDNILACSRYMMIHCGTGDDAWNPVFRGNTFVQYAGGDLGRFGQSPTRLLPYIYQSFIREELEGNEYYLIDND